MAFFLHFTEKNAAKAWWPFATATLKLCFFVQFRHFPLNSQCLPSIRLYSVSNCCRKSLLVSFSCCSGNVYPTQIWAGFKLKYISMKNVSRVLVYVKTKRKIVQPRTATMTSHLPPSNCLPLSPRIHSSFQVKHCQFGTSEMVHM